jgi:hypothetical protein
MQHGVPAQLDLIPTQIDKLGSPKAVPKGREDHGGVAKAVAVVPRDLD